jgi:exopolyphosphatase / guanosine-5'-triphosphate,3'-diphosphate pyrophosphatase
MIDFRRRVRGADPDNRIRGIGAGQGPAEQRRAAIIDIGSNSVRLVVYAGPARAPTPVFNEKLMVGLGSGLASSGSIEPKPYRRAMAGLARFKALTEAMEIRDLRCVATAAVRDASNGAQFLTEARALGLSIDLLSGEDEARAAGYGVISAIPDADGIVADLGGGSLELVRVKDGATAHHSSFPLGVLRLAKLRGAHGARFGKAVARMIAEAGWPNGDSGLPLYLVGGSWRALARYDMIMARDPMPVVSGHVMPVAAAARLARRLRHADPAALALQPGLSSARTSTMADASALLVPLVAQLGSNRLIVSTSGLREGLLFQSLSPAIRAEDPLIAAAEAEGRRFARFAPHGRDIDRWIAPLFPDDDDAAARLRWRRACSPMSHRPPTPISVTSGPPKWRCTGNGWGSILPTAWCSPKPCSSAPADRVGPLQLLPMPCWSNGCCARCNGAARSAWHSDCRAERPVRSAKAGWNATRAGCG